MKKRIGPDAGPHRFGQVALEWIRFIRSHEALSVFCVLCAHFNAKSRIAFPSVPTIAKFAAISERAVYRGLAELDYIGAIDRKLSHDGGVNNYVVNPPPPPPNEIDPSGLIQLPAMNAVATGCIINAIRDERMGQWFSCTFEPGQEREGRPYWEQLESVLLFNSSRELIRLANRCLILEYRYLRKERGKEVALKRQALTPEERALKTAQRERSKMQYVASRRRAAQ